MEGIASQENLLLFTDSYKITHHMQYPPDLTALKAYFESRGGKFDRVVFFGLQYVLKRYLETTVTREMIDEAEEIIDLHFGRPGLFNRSGWEHIVNAHGGRLPLRIRAAPEGSLVPAKELLFTVESTDEKVAWLANYVETALVQVWYPLTVCTNSFMQKVLIERYLRDTADNSDGLLLKLHDFGFRGATTREAAGLGGLAHLVNFNGSDTLEALVTARKYYGHGDKGKIAGVSIPATEHSTMTTWGPSRERDAMRHMLESFPVGPVAVVSDSYDLWNFLEEIVGGELKGIVEQRSPTGPLVIRPDSGDPVDNVLRVLATLEKKFGAAENGKGFKVLPPYIRVIQGDGICYESVGAILAAMKKFSWSAENLTFGSGGALLQKLNRDTQKCAYKCCWAKVGGKVLEVYKDPVTDPGKRSKAGNLTLVKDNADGGRLRTVKIEDIKESQVDFLETVFLDGVVTKSWSLEEVRKRAHEAMEEVLGDTN